MTTLEDKKVTYEYKDTAIRMLHYNFPNLTNDELNMAVDYSINKRYKQEDAVIDNNYKNKQVSITLSDLTEYIMDRQPIMTAYGVLFKRNGEVPNPTKKLLQKFMEGRDIYKKKMFTFPKGSDDFEKYNLLQLLAKIDANGFYGVIGQFSSLFYNLHVAASVTTTGRSLISACGLQFEMFLSNNVKFGSLNEAITFIDNVCSERGKRKYNDKDILDKDISIEDCFAKLISTCGFEWLPTDKELNILWDIVSRLDQDNINRIYYKNNLYEFMANSTMTNAITEILVKLKKPFMNPNKVPKEIEVELEVFCDLLKEFVYYSYQIIDRIDRMANMIKNVTILSDTDSAIVSLDAWYRCVLEKIQGKPMEILNQYHSPIEIIKRDEFGDLDLIKPIEFVEPNLDYDFYTDEVIELERLSNPITIIPQDNLRYSIINIIAHCLTDIINDYMVQYTKNSHSYEPDRKCLIYMKNEFLFKRALLTMGMKNYATIQELQEGNYVGDLGKPDIKGLPITKSTLNKKTRDQLEKILYEDILNIPHIDQINVLKKLAIMEKQIFNSLSEGNKEYYKPVSIKSYAKYDDPMRIQGIKASIVWNELRDEGVEVIDLEIKNNIDIVKVNITPMTVEKIKDTYPDKYEKIKQLLTQKGFDTITAIAIPREATTPDWVKEFIDYGSIINDNIKNFPLESIGLSRAENDKLNYTNILKI